MDHYFESSSRLCRNFSSVFIKVVNLPWAITLHHYHVFAATSALSSSLWSTCHGPLLCIIVISRICRNFSSVFTIMVNLPWAITLHHHHVFSATSALFWKWSTCHGPLLWIIITSLPQLQLCLHHNGQLAMGHYFASSSRLCRNFSSVFTIMVNLPWAITLHHHHVFAATSALSTTWSTCHGSCRVHGLRCLYFCIQARALLCAPSEDSNQSDQSLRCPHEESLGP